MSKKSRNRARISKNNGNVFSGFDWERWARRFQLILALVVPFAFLEGLYNYVNLPRAVLIQISVVSILLIWLLGAVAQNELRIRRTPFDLPEGLYPTRGKASRIGKCPASAIFGCSRSTAPTGRAFPDISGWCRHLQQLTDSAQAPYPVHFATRIFEPPYSGPRHIRQ